MFDIKVWVGCLACYSEGRLRGEWLDGSELYDFCEMTTETGLRRIGCAHPAEHEETWVMDHEGFPEQVLKGECSPMEALRLAEWLDTELAPASWDDEGTAEALLMWAADSYPDVTEADLAHGYDQLSRIITGSWTPDEDFAQDYYEDVYGGELGPLSDYIDWGHVAHELMMDFSTYDLPSGGRAYFHV